MKPFIFMLDTGSSLSLLKISKVPKYVHINDKEIIVLRGITSHAITTLGKIEIFLDDHKIQFHIVSEDFPIKEARILGSDFFRQTNARINYKSNHLQFSTLKIPFMEGGQVIDRVNNYVSTIQAHKPITVAPPRNQRASDLQEKSGSASKKIREPAGVSEIHKWTCKAAN